MSRTYKDPRGEYRYVHCKEERLNHRASVRRIRHSAIDEEEMELTKAIKRAKTFPIWLY